MVDALTLEDTVQQSGQQAAGTSASVDDEPMTQSDAENADSLLHRCFAAALLYRLPRDSTAFPYDAGQFYSHCLLRCVPAGARLDMRHTRYKKFIVFLREMAGVERVVDIREQAPGVWAIVSVDYKHDMLTRFTPSDEQLTDAVEKCVHVCARLFTGVCHAQARARTARLRRSVSHNQIGAADCARVRHYTQTRRRHRATFAAYCYRCVCRQACK
jgi:hypothetical protein